MTSIITGKLKVGRALTFIVLELYAEMSMGSIILAAFGYINWKWAVLAIVAPIMVVVAFYTLLSIVLLVLAFRGSIPSDKQDWTEE